MQSYFIWKGISSRDAGVWVTSLPPESRPEERVEHIEIPGRAGDLTILEGEHVYKSIAKTCVVTASRELEVSQLLEWLTGKSDVIFSSSPDKAYSARIVNEVSFQNISNTLCQATIVFYCQPFRHNAIEELPITLQAGVETSIYNPGNVPSKPLITIGAVQSISLTVNGETMSIVTPMYDATKTYHPGEYTYGENGYMHVWVHDFAPGDTWDDSYWKRIYQLHIDCDAGLAYGITNTDELYIYERNITGDFFTLKPGWNTITPGTGTGETVIKPRWRWL